MIKILKFTFLIIIVSCIGLFLDISNIRVPDGIDKIYHFLLFFVATLFFLFAYLKIFGRKWITQSIIILLISGGIMATFLEKVQNFSTSRSCDYMDWLFNILGIAVAAFIFYIVTIRLSRSVE